MTQCPKAAVLVAALVLAAAPRPAPAQTPSRPMPGAAMPMTPNHTGPAPGASMSATDRMARDMAAVPMTGDADQDFAAMMIPHHQGAIDMARDELAHGKDPVMRKLAKDVIAAQQREIAGMQAWQARHPARR